MSSAAHSLHTDSDNVSPEQFLKHVRDLTELRDKEDRKRAADIEKEIAQSREQRRQRRADHARSLSNLSSFSAAGESRSGSPSSNISPSRQNAPALPAHTKSHADESEPSRSEIANSLASKDPSWFKQTSDRGLGSPAFRKSQAQHQPEQQASPGATGSSSFKLTGMSNSERAISPLAEQPRAISPSRVDSIRSSEAWSNRLSIASSTSEAPSKRSSMILEGPKLIPTPDGNSGRTSPTKGFGGFVQSAMLKRSDSMTKRFSGTGPQRSGSNAGNRNSYIAKQNAESMATPTIPAEESTPRTGTTTPTHLRSKSVASINNGVDGEESEKTAPPSPSKRWSPTKSTWLESQIKKSEEKPKPKPTPPPSSQPAWMTDLAKAKQQKTMTTESPKLLSPISDEKLKSPPKKTISVSPPIAKSPPIIKSTTSPKSSFATSKVQTVTTPPTKSSSPVASTVSNSATKPSSSVASTATAGKFDFRANLKPRAKPADDDKDKVPEFKNALGKLKKTQTERYVAPDTLKDNILRGKSALNSTGDPAPRQRVDELKESLLKQKEAMKTKAAIEPIRSEKPKNTVTTPEAFVAKRSLQRVVTPPGSGSGSKPVEINTFKSQQQKTPEKSNSATTTKPAYLLRLETSSTATTKPVNMFKQEPVKSIPLTTNKSANIIKEESVKPSITSTIKPAVEKRVWQKPEAKPEAKAEVKPSATVPNAAGTIGSVKGKLMERMNPALAGMLSRGPPVLNAPKDKGISVSIPDSTNKVITAENPSGGDIPELTHMTKGRARGPKRRAPKSTVTKSFEETANEPVKEVVPIPTDPISTSPSQQRPELIMKSISDLSAEDASPTSPISPAFAQKYETLNKTRMSLSIKSSPPRQNPFSRTSRSSSISDYKSNIVKEKPTIPLKSPDLAKMAEEFSVKPISSQPKTDTTTNSSSTDQSMESNAYPKPLQPAKNITERWNQKVEVSPPIPHGFRSPINLSNRNDTRKHIENSDLLNRNDSTPSFQSSIGAIPAGLNLGLTSIGSKSSDMDAIKKQYPMSPPLSAGFSDKSSQGVDANSGGLPTPASSQPSTLASPAFVRSHTPRAPSISIKIPPGESPNPSSSDTAKLFSEFFDDEPYITAEPEIDVLQMIETDSFTQEKVTTVRVQVQEISGDGKLQSLPVDKQHILFEESMYICIHTFQSGRSKATEVFFWTGSGVSPAAIEDAQIFANRSAKENFGKLIFVKQGKEPAAFFQALGGIVITFRGSRSKSTQSGLPERYLLCGRRHLGQVAFDETDFSLSSFCSGFPFLASSPTTTGGGPTPLYLWKGSGCTADELGCARLIAMDLSSNATVVEIDDGAEPSSFMALFPNSRSAKIPTHMPPSASHWRLKPSVEGKFQTRLFRVAQRIPRKNSGASAVASQVSSFFGGLVASSLTKLGGGNISTPPRATSPTLAASPDRPTSLTLSPSRKSLLQQPGSPNRPVVLNSPGPSTPGSPGDSPGVEVIVEEIVPFSQEDLSGSAVYVLDAFFEIYIILSPSSHTQYHAFSSALLFAQDYGILAASAQDRPFVPVSTVVLEGAPRDLRAVFRGWKSETSATASSPQPQSATATPAKGGLKRGGSLRVVGLAAALAAVRR